MFLRSSFDLTAVVQFENHSFPDAEERVVLLLADGKDGKGAGELRLVSVRNPEEVGDLQTLIRRSEVFYPHEQPRKWETQFHDSAASILDRLSASGYLVPLRSIGKASIGYVTGANKYFALTRSETRRLEFPPSVLRPTVVSARHVSGAVFSKADLLELIRLDGRCFLWTGAGADIKAVADYIEQGKSRGVSSRYKCRVRDPWYVVPGVVEPDAFLTYMSDQIPRFILNGARATCSNTLLAVRLDGVDRPLRSTFVAAFYNSATMLSAERTGRRYGGGVLKLEPSEADRVLVPSPELCERLEVDGLRLDHVDALLRSQNIRGVLSEVDKLFLKNVPGLDIRELEAIRSSLLRRREARKRKPQISVRATATKQARSD